MHIVCAYDGVAPCSEMSGAQGNPLGTAGRRATEVEPAGHGWDSRHDVHEGDAGSQDVS
jgi:hypothetical protein